MRGDEDREILSGSEKGRRDSKEEEAAKGNGHEAEAAGGGSGEENGVTDEQKAKEERIAASLRKREEEVKANLAGSMRQRDKERGQHLRLEDTTNQQRVKLVTPDPIMEIRDLAPSSQRSSTSILPKRAAKTAALNGILKNFI